MKKIMAVLAVLAVVVFAAPSFAANPFTDVPAGHWAHDAVAQLAARGVVSGYPDGTYKGMQPMTRYEMASMIARALATVDMEKASKRDMELLKKLVLEFKNELDALGVKVNDLDKRVAVLEDGVGGWKIRGAFYFDAQFAGDDHEYNKSGHKIEFAKERFRLFLTKTIDENTYFYAEYRVGDASTDGMGDIANSRWADLYIDTMIFWDMGLRVGRFGVDFEGDYDLYTDNDPIFGLDRVDGFRLTKSFGMLNATAIAGRNSKYIDGPAANDSMGYVLDLNIRPSEKFFLGATGFWLREDDGDDDRDTYGIYAGYNFTPAIGLKGIYYIQDYGDTSNAWKAILDVKQDALKFTSLWVEYSRIDNDFAGREAPYGIGCTDSHILRNKPANSETSRVWFAKATQQWNDKWSTYLRFATVDYDTKHYDDAREWTVGVGYQYTPAIKFELLYSNIDYGDGSAQIYQDTESVFRFRTAVSF